MTDVRPRPPCSALVEPGRVRHYAPDMTVTASADVRLDALQAALGDQWLPIDGPGEATLGALVEINSTGPLRLGYGAWRDLLLGVQFRNGLGELITAGGRTVKNVAGYDLVKLMVGQGGCLGELVTITARTYLRPAGALFAEFGGDAEGFAALSAGNVRPQWALLGEGALWCGYLGDEAAIAFYESAGGGADPGCGVVLIPEAADPRVVAAGVGGCAYRVEPGGPPQWSPDDPVQRRILAALKQAFDPHGRLPAIIA
jgi:FAD/FMN-containing dehydrogenase